jgi:hypothetical protein
MTYTDAYGIKKRFKDHAYITKDDLLLYFQEEEPGLKDTTFRWRIHHLKESRILLPVKRGLYSLNKEANKTFFDPPDTRRMDDLYSIYFSNFKMETCALWSTEWLAQFMGLQPTHYFTVFEIEKELTYPLFFHLQQAKTEAFLNPDADMMRDYVMKKKNPVVVKPLLSRAPLQKTQNNLPIASLEKILVDIFCDTDVFISYQGSALKDIFNNAWKTYSINLSSLINYAKRRKREKPLLEFLQKHVAEMYKPLSK